MLNNTKIQLNNIIGSIIIELDKFIEDYYYKVYYSYAKYKIQDHYIDVLNYDHNEFLCTGYRILDLATEDDQIFNKIFGSYSITDQNYLDDIKKLVNFCSLEFPDIDIKFGSTIFDSKNIEIKVINKLTEMFLAIINLLIINILSKNR
jgi:hypothetical protein